MNGVKDTLNLADLERAERQAFAEYLDKEWHRHMDDVAAIEDDLRLMKLKYGIVPTGKFVDKWIQV